MSGCHYGNVLVFKQGNLRIYGGGAYRGAKPWPGMHVLDLVGGIHGENVTITHVTWPNHAIPIVNEGYWLRLASCLRANAAATKGPSDVLVVCKGGHGRTGTALTILGCLMGFIPEKQDPVLWMRKHYCQNAVESTSQVRYITQMTQRKVTTQAKPYRG